MTYYDEHTEQPARPHRGCLMGALAAVVTAVVILAALVGYSAWYFHKGFDNDPRIKAILIAAEKDNQAAQILGHKIKVMQLEHYAYGYESGKGGAASYAMKVAGNRGAGELKAELDVTGHAPVVKQLTLIDDEGHKYYLIGEAPPNPLLQNSI